MILWLTMRSTFCELLDRGRLEVSEVEAEAIRRDERAGLLDVVAKHEPQRPVQQMRGCVIAPDALAAHDVDRGATTSSAAEKEPDSTTPM